jgi:hypothetical protein
LDLSPGISYFFGQLGKAFFAPGSHASLLSLVGAFLIAFAFLMFRRYRKGRRIRVRALLRALFPRHIVGSKSTLADLGYFYFNIFCSAWCSAGRCCHTKSSAIPSRRG